MPHIDRKWFEKQIGNKFLIAIEFRHKQVRILGRVISVYEHSIEFETLSQTSVIMLDDIALSMVTNRKVTRDA